MDARLVLVCARDPRRGRARADAYVRAHARAAAALDLEPRLVCGGEDEGRAASPSGVVRRVRTGGAGGALGVPFVVEALAAAALEEAEGAGAVLFHGFGLGAHAAVAAASRLARRGVEAYGVASLVPTVEAGTGPGASAWLGRLGGAWTAAAGLAAERSTCRRADAVLVHHEAHGAALLRRHGRAVRVRVVPFAPEHAFDRAAREGLPRSRVLCGAPIVVAAARHVRPRGMDLLLRALARLERDGVRFRAYVLGGGPCYEANRRLARGLGLEGRVALLGDGPEVEPYLARADVFVWPAREDPGGPGAVFDAIAAGVPVLATRVGGLAEDLVHGISAWLVPPGSADALADGLVHLLGDPALRARLAAGARAREATRFSADRFVAGLAAAYAEAGFVWTGVVAAPEGRVP